MTARSSLVLTAALAAGAAGCSENVVGLIPDSGVEVPIEDAGPDTLDGGEDPNAYPLGPYGAFLGDTLQPMSFKGYVNDHPSAGRVEDSGYVEDFTLQDIRELGTYDFLLINVAAEWCQGCRVEAQQIPALYERWADRGGYVLSVITEDVSGRPATKRHLDGWLANFAINYTMVHDPQEFVNRELGPESLPMNVIVNLKTMEILHRVIGEDLTIFETFEGLLGD